MARAAGHPRQAVAERRRLVAAAIPGSRLLVYFEDDPGWGHERLVTWPLSSERLLVLTGDGDHYDEAVGDYSYVADISGSTDLPAHVVKSVSFEEALTPADVLGYVTEGRRLAGDVAANESLSAPPSQSEYLAWDGTRCSVPGDWTSRWRLRRKTGKDLPVRRSRLGVRPSALRGRGGTAKAAADRASTPDGNEKLERAGRAWVVMDPTVPEFGQTVEVIGADLVDGDVAIHRSPSGAKLLVRSVALGEVASLVEKARENINDGPPARPGVDLRDRLGLSAAKADQPAVAEPEADVRTLWVEYDERGRRHRPWRLFCSEITKSDFSDWSIHFEGPDVALDMLTFFERQGGDPRLWANLWMTQCHVSPRERTGIEVSMLTETLWLGGSYDQVNGPSLAMVERVCRRLAQITEAYDVDPQKPNWSSVRFISSDVRSLNPVPKEMRSYNAKRVKEEVELENAKSRTTSRTERQETLLGGADPVAAAEAGLPKGKGKGRKQEAERQRVLAAAEAK